MLMQLKQIVSVFIEVNPTPFCIPLSSVKSLGPSLDKVISWFNATNNSQYSPTIVQKLFGMLHDGNDKKLSRFNYCLLLAK